MCDNTTAINYVNNMGGIKSNNCNDIANQIWEWCSRRDIWLSVVFISGKENKTADAASRTFDNDATEWELHQSLFDLVAKKLGPLETDPFCCSE